MPNDGLARWLSGARRVVIIGIGNPLRGDDNVGVRVVQSLQGKTSESVYLVESETTPESFIEPITEFSPTHILMVDAALLGLAPGSMKFVKSLNTTTIPISTHALPIRLFWQYLAETTGAKIGMILIEPRNVDFGEGLTPDVEKALKSLVEVLLVVPAIGKTKLFPTPAVKSKK